MESRDRRIFRQVAANKSVSIIGCSTRSRQQPRQPRPQQQQQALSSPRINGTLFCILVESIMMRSKFSIIISKHSGCVEKYRLAGQNNQLCLRFSGTKSIEVNKKCLTTLLARLLHQKMTFSSALHTTRGQWSRKWP